MEGLYIRSNIAAVRLSRSEIMTSTIPMFALRKHCHLHVHLSERINDVHGLNPLKLKYVRCVEIVRAAFARISIDLLSRLKPNSL